MALPLGGGSTAAPSSRNQSKQTCTSPPNPRRIEARDSGNVGMKAEQTVRSARSRGRQGGARPSYTLERIAPVRPVEGAQPCATPGRRVAHGTCPISSRRRWSAVLAQWRVCAQPCSAGVGMPEIRQYLPKGRQRAAG
eukprot:scaffold26383_cov31-Tisochrysis_lutea.AAC.2